MFISFDWETPYGDDFSVVDLGYDRYARDPRCLPYLISVCDGKESWAGEPREFNFESLRGKKLISHNRPFDREIAIAGVERGLWPFPDPLGIEWHCTLDMAAYLWNVRSLKDAAKIGLGIDLDKGVRDRAKNKSPEDMKSEGWWPDMLKYGISDAHHCWSLWDQHNHKWPAQEREISWLTMEQGRHGIRIDVAALVHGITMLEKVIFQAEQNLPWVKRGNKPASPIGIAEECRIWGIPPPPVKARDPEAAQDWEDLYAPKHLFVLALKNLRKAKKTLATLRTIQLRLRPDDTIAFSLKYAGASTLRWAGDSGFNLQNMAKEPMFFDEKYSFIFDKKTTRPFCEEFDKEHAGQRAHGTLKNGIRFFDFRGLVCARPGMVLCPVDLAQIEPRVLNYLAGNRRLLDLVRKGMAIYEAHARATMGWTEGDLKTLNKMLYALAKARVLGLGYGCGWEKFILLAAIYGIDITEGDEEFALRASIDGKLHERRQLEVVRPHRRTGAPIVVRQWQYVSLPGDGKFSSSFPRLDPAVAVREPDLLEKCCFVKVEKTNRDGSKEIVTKAFGTYGMRSRVTVKEFRETNTEIMGLHDRMQKALENAIGGDLVIEGPHGGTLVYRDVRVEYRKKKDKETGEEYEKRNITALVGGKRCILYGGLLVENLVQWVSRCVFAERQTALDTWLKAMDPAQRVLFSVHDEAVPELWIQNATEENRKKIQEIMSITPAWLGDCPLGAEAFFTLRYKK